MVAGHKRGVRRAMQLTGAAAVIGLCAWARPGTASSTTTATAASSAKHVAADCTEPTALCTEVNGWKGTFPYYVGHDEPSALFYSNKPGSGYQMNYNLTLPRDPGNPTNYSTASTSNTYNEELHPTFWFGMAMCDTQSYPQQNLKTCTPDSDSNITPNTYAGMAKHAGTAFMEMQFYPPGDNHQPDAVNPCLVGQAPGDNEWCAALNIDSLSEDPVHGTELNSSCQGTVGSTEYVNFAIVTTTGHTPGPANPIDSNQQTFDGSPQNPTYFMNSGDRLRVTFHDIPDSKPLKNGSGLQVVIDDLTTHTTGSMTASKANGFAMVKKAPSPSTACTAIPYNFHPMYSTSSPSTRVIWAAHTYNIAFSDEIGHWDNCSAVPSSTTFQCNPHNLSTIMEGPPGHQEQSDVDDTGCFPPSATGTLPVSRCIGINGGFDGFSYTQDWPTGETPSGTVPTPVAFSSPLTGGTTAAQDTVQYSDVAFETDLPRVEGNDLPGTKNNCQRLEFDQNGKRVAGAGNDCFVQPLTDDSTANKPQHAVYPWFNTFTSGGACMWQIGMIPSNGSSINSFGKVSQWGPLEPVTYLSGSGTAPSTGTKKTIVNLEDFLNDLGTQPCPG